MIPIQSANDGNCLLRTLHENRTYHAAAPSAEHAVHGSSGPHEFSAQAEKSTTFDKICISHIAK